MLLLNSVVGDELEIELDFRVDLVVDANFDVDFDDEVDIDVVCCFFVVGTKTCFFVKFGIGARDVAFVFGKGISERCSLFVIKIG